MSDMRAHGMKPKIRVMVVDDSATVRQVLSRILTQAPDIEVIGTAADPLFALEKMQRNWPDVIVLDVEMPRMDGISFLKKLMAEHPTPVVICSSLTEKSADSGMQALALGAVEIITKPQLGLKQFLLDRGEQLIGAVRAAACARPRLLLLPQEEQIAPQGTEAALQASAPMSLETTDKVVAIGTSTGGTQALEILLSSLAQDVPGMVIVQHMPEKFTRAFAMRLNSRCIIEVREAREGDRVLPGLALIAPGGRHLLLKRSGAQYRVSVEDGPQVNRHKPSVDVLFRSVARCAGSNALGIIMTGMGDDGARGLKAMHDAGALTLAQDEASCVVYGMPREAIKLNAVTRTVALHRLGQEITALSKKKTAA